MADQRRLFSLQSLRTAWRALFSADDRLTAEEAASTLFRFFRSKHVADLKLIATLAWLIAFLFSATVVVSATWLAGGPANIIGKTLTNGVSGQLLNSQSASAATKDSEQSVQKQRDPPPYLKLLTLIGPAFSVAGAIAAWAYLSASGRLGIVDLFACEISTLCRVGTIVDVAKRLVDELNAEPPKPNAVVERRPGSSDDFSSKEEYFPVFSSNSKDLEALEAMVVTHITEFYTYMKATRDSLRKRAAIDPAASDPALWRAALVNVIYMLFLAYESGRKSIKSLIEFQPTAAEVAIVILISELKCYGALQRAFDKDDIRCKRLSYRAEAYRSEVPEVFGKVFAHGNNVDWKPACLLLSELDHRYYEVFKRRLTPPTARAGAGASTEVGGMQAGAAELGSV